jgi:hypothetical protein
LTGLATGLLGRGHARAFGEGRSGALALAFEALHLGLQRRDPCCQLGNLLLLLSNHSQQVVATPQSKFLRQRHSVHLTAVDRWLQAEPLINYFGITDAHLEVISFIGIVSM